MESKEEAAVERQKLVPDDTENEPDDDQMMPPPPNIIIATSTSGGGATSSGHQATASVASTATSMLNNNSKSSSAAQQTPISPVLSHKIFSSGETSRTQDSSNCSMGRGGGGGGGGGGSGGGHMESCGGISGGGSAGVGGGGKSFGEHSSTRLVYVNERSGKQQLDAKQQQQADYKAKARRIQRDDDAISTTTPPVFAPNLFQNRSVSHQSLPQVPNITTMTPATIPVKAQSTIIPTLPTVASPLIIVPNTNTTTTVPLLHAPPSTDTAQTTHVVHIHPTPDNPQPSSSATNPTTATTSNLVKPEAAPAAAAATTAAASGSSGGGGANNNVTFDQRQLKHHSFVSEVPDVRHMERALLGLLEDFHLGKLKAFGSGCTMDQMTDIREQQESLAKLHFELGAGGDPLNGAGAHGGAGTAGLNAQENMTQLVAKLENLSVSIERLHSSNSNL